MSDQFSDDLIIGLVLIIGIIVPAAVAGFLALIEMKREQKDWL